MGNSTFPKTSLKSSILSGDVQQVRTILEELESDFARNTNSTTSTCPHGYRQDRTTGISHRSWLLSQPINKKGDTALILAVRHGHFQIVNYLLDCGVQVNVQNKEKDTALDVLLKKALPCEGDILHFHFCPDYFPNAHQNDKEFVLPPEARPLLLNGAKGSSLHMVILHIMKDEGKLRELSELIKDLEIEENFRLSGLLLQASVWFDQTEFLKDLLTRGMEPENFWKAQFIPAIVPNTDYRRTVDIWERLTTETEGDYVLNTPDDTTVDSSATLQSLKLAFVQDWRADWFDCQNPDAQYRAGLLLTIDGATVMIKAANNDSLLDHVVKDLMQYLPPICGGPDLKNTALIPYLILSGYDFSIQQVMHLKLKYNLDFSPYQRYATTVKPLKHLCRLGIRARVHTNVFHAVSKLVCLPSELQKFLLLNDIDKCIVEE